MTIGWLTAFLDTPRPAHDASTAFWQRITGSTLSATRGDHGQFATVLPPDGDAYLRVQAIDAGNAHTHLDLHVTDFRVVAADAAERGATLVADHGDVIVLHSPAGLEFCVVELEDERTRLAAGTHPDGSTSLLDQLCIDVPSAYFDAELAWWSGFTGWPARVGNLAEFSHLRRPAGLPLRLLFQRLDEPDGMARSHLDFACSDRRAEVARHVAAGATHIARRQEWDVLRDPAGREYCLTDRDPETGTMRG